MKALISFVASTVVSMINIIKSKSKLSKVIVSATPERSDHLDDIVYMLLGPIRHKYTVREQADAWGLDRYVYPRFTRVVNISGGQLDIHKAGVFDQLNKRKYR